MFHKGNSHDIQVIKTVKIHLEQKAKSEDSQLSSEARVWVAFGLGD